MSTAIHERARPDRQYARMRLMFRLMFAAVMALTFLHGHARAEEEIQGIALVKIEDPKKGTIPDMVHGYGTISPSSGSSSTFSFQRDGLVAKFHVEVGDPVKKGDQLLDYDTAPDVVTSYQQAAAILKFVQSTRARTAQLYAQQLATRMDLDRAEHDVLDAQMVVTLQEIKGGAKPKETLVAPFDGVVTAIPVSQGDRLGAGTALLTLTRTDALVLIVGVEPSRIDKVQPEQLVKLEALSTGKKPMDGKVRRVGAAIDPKTRLGSAIIDMPLDGVLAGESFRSGIVIGQLQGWVVPRGAIGRDKKGAFIWQIDKNAKGKLPDGREYDGKAKRVNVDVIGMAGKIAIFDGPIDIQMEIVTSGNYQITESNVPLRIDTGLQVEEEEDEP
jgi:membrane fusion protein (multidrug efflux system)